MDRAHIAQYLGLHPWADKILVYDEVGSTNTLLKSLGQQGAPHGTVVIADHQTAGRGRLGRRFQSPGGVGIYLSALIRLQCVPSQIMHLTCAVAVAMCDAVEAACGIRPGIKWINDLVIGTKKLGGILTELTLDPVTQQVDSAIIGIGINCRQLEEDFDPSIRHLATSLRLATRKDVDSSRLAGEMIRSLHRMSQELLTQKDATMTRYNRDCITIGKQIQVIRGESIRPGQALGIDSDGGLIVSYSDGTCETVSSGEVSVRGMYGYV